MDRYEKAVEFIRAKLETAKLPALFFSGGKESILLLDMLDSLNGIADRVPLITLYDEWGSSPERFNFLEETFRSQSRVFINFWPQYRFLVPSLEGHDLVNAYDLSGQTLPVVVSAVDDGSKTLHCALDWLRLPRKDCPDFCFDMLLNGGRHTDTHLWFNVPYPRPEIGIAKSTLCLPLWDWSEEQVWETIREKKIPYDEDRYDNHSIQHLGAARVCTRCLQGPTNAFFCSKVGEVVQI